ncbi:MAG: molybdate ABC transporter substrate-binding protein [Hyphomonadaceae bacterium]
MNETSRPVRRWIQVLVCMLVAAIALSACHRDEPKPSAAAPTPSVSVAAAVPAIEQQKLMVFAASSLKEAFEEMALEFKKQHPEAEVTFNFAGTQQLRTQLEQGAAADVFASADQRHMKELVSGGRVQSPRVLAENELISVVEKAQQGRVKGLADLPKLKRIVVGAPEVPVGKYTQVMLDNASKTLGADFKKKVEAAVVSRELNVRQVLAKVTLGEAEAGVVYRTDVTKPDPKLALIEIPKESNVIAEYPIGVVNQAAHAGLAAAWVELALSEVGQGILRARGFLPAHAAEKAP